MWNGLNYTMIYTKVNTFPWQTGKNLLFFRKGSDCMQYGKMVEGIFLARPNRFIAHVEIEGKVEVCHVKNTGRCR